mmetsp:Transcript_25052/g.28798  ORF Transcript_25052/g.28798 Transcript_25052/m.28798 type:complete len:273 (+) Transcript_25052:40-858(+)
MQVHLQLSRKVIAHCLHSFTPSNTSPSLQPLTLQSRRRNMDKTGKRVNRIDQLDAMMIDAELGYMLFAQLVRIMDYFPHGMKVKYEDELRLLLDYLFYKMTIGSNNRTPGNLLQNLDFGLDRAHLITNKQKFWYVILSILLPYFFKKLKLDQKFKWIMKTLKVAKFINFILFLKTFEYRNLIERILQIKLYHVEQNLERNMDFTFINRVIVWNALGKAMTSFLPFLDFTKITSFFASTASITSYCNVDSSDLESICGVCQSSSLCMPYKTGV